MISQGANSYTLLLLNLISLQMKVYFELIGISEYQIVIVTAYTKSASVVDSI